MTGYTVPLAELRMTDVETVGGKNASHGEMIGRLSGAGVRVPDDVPQSHLEKELMLCRTLKYRRA